MLSWWTQKKLSLQLQCRIGRKKSSALQIEVLGEHRLVEHHGASPRAGVGAAWVLSDTLKLQLPALWVWMAVSRGWDSPQEQVSQQMALLRAGLPLLYTAAARVSVVQPERCGDLGLFGAVSWGCCEGFLPLFFLRIKSFLSNPAQLYTVIHVCSSAAAFCRERPCTPCFERKRSEEGLPFCTSV